MEREEYQPIACGLHELYQLAAMRGARLDISWEGESGEQLKANLKVVDVFTRKRAEYLSGETASGERYQVRLDRILSASWANSGRTLQADAE